MTTTDIASHDLVSIPHHMHAFHDLHALRFQAGRQAVNTTIRNTTNAGVALLPQQQELRMTCCVNLSSACCCCL